MREFNTTNTLASAIGLLVLIALVSLAAWLVAPWEHYWVSAIAGYFFTIPLALAAWTGVLFRHNDGSIVEPKTWRDWIVIFSVGLGVSVVFILIDLAIRHPGISLVFTFGAVSMTLVALPSAVRAWLLELWLPNVPDKDSDA